MESNKKPQRVGNFYYDVRENKKIFDSHVSNSEKLFYHRQIIFMIRVRIILYVYQTNKVVIIQR